jgi:hypothetical protein
MFFPATHKSDAIAFSQNDHLPDSVYFKTKAPTATVTVGARTSFNNDSPG